MNLYWAIDVLFSVLCGIGVGCLLFCWGMLCLVEVYCVLLDYAEKGCVEGCCHASGGNHEHTLYLQVLMTKMQNHMSNLLLLKNHLIYTILSTKCSIPI